MRSHTGTRGGEMSIKSEQLDKRIKALQERYAFLEVDMEDEEYEFSNFYTSILVAFELHYDLSINLRCAPTNESHLHAFKKDPCTFLQLFPSSDFENGETDHRVPKYVKTV
jgi:hypothetical protein